MAGLLPATARFAPDLSRYIAIYFKYMHLRDMIVARLWLTRGRIARFLKLPKQPAA